VLWILFFYTVWSIPLIIAFKGTKQSVWQCRIKRNNIGQMVALGIILGVINFAVYGFLAPYLGGGFLGFSTSLILIYLSILSLAW